MEYYGKKTVFCDVAASVLSQYYQDEESFHSGIWCSATYWSLDMKSRQDTEPIHVVLVTSSSFSTPAYWACLSKAS